MPPNRRVMPACAERTLQILYVYSRDSTFIAIDRELLGRRWRIREWPQPRPRVNLIALARAVRRSDLVFGWFASWHTFWPVTLAWLLRRPSVLVIGGFDTAKLPEIDYGLQQRAVMGRVSRWMMRRATRLVTNSHYSRREIEANIGISPGAVRVVHHGVPDPFGELPSGPRERLVLTVGIIEQRNLERKGLSAFVAGRPPARREFVVAGTETDASADELRAARAERERRPAGSSRMSSTRFTGEPPSTCRPRATRASGCLSRRRCWPGCVPVVTAAGALPEVVGDAGIVLGEAPAPSELAEGVRRALALGEGAGDRPARRISSSSR